MSDRLLKVSEVADILRVSQMTVIRKCREGLLPFIRVGTMRRIREIDLEYYMLNPNRKPKAPELERPVYVGLPADQCGFDNEADEEERQRKTKEQCEKLKVIVADREAKKASAVKAPELPIRITNERGTGLFPSGFDVLFEE